MCWSASASVAMVAAGGAAMAVTALRGEPKAIWLTLGYFTAIEALQAAGYAVVDACGSPANRTITLLSYLHIVFQPLVINALAMALAPVRVGPKQRRRVYAIAGVCSALLLVKLLPIEALGVCRPGSPLCGPVTCLVSGDWHIAWMLALNGLFDGFGAQLGLELPFPAYFFAVFILPLWYGAWRLVLVHLVLGPVAAMALTSNSNEMPAVWCLFSIGIILVALSPFLRYRVMGAFRPA